MRILGTSNENYAGSSDSEVRLRGVDRVAVLCQLVLYANSFAVSNAAAVNQFIESGR